MTAIRIVITNTNIHANTILTPIHALTGDLNVLLVAIKNATNRTINALPIAPLNLISAIQSWVSSAGTIDLNAWILAPKITIKPANHLVSLSLISV